MERAAPDASGGGPLVGPGAQEGIDPSQHLGGGTPREREQADPLRPDPALDEVSDAVRERRRLSRSSAGDDEQGASP